MHRTNSNKIIAKPDILQCIRFPSSMWQDSTAHNQQLRRPRLVDDQRRDRILFRVAMLEWCVSLVLPRLLACTNHRHDVYLFPIPDRLAKMDLPLRFAQLKLPSLQSWNIRLTRPDSC